MRILENYIGITVIGPQENSQGSHQISVFIYTRSSHIILKSLFGETKSNEHRLMVGKYFDEEVQMMGSWLS